MSLKGIYQQNKKDCGVACLLTIIKYYGGNNTYENIRYLTKCDNTGITALNLIEASKKLGFNARGLKCSYVELKKIKLPAIANVVINDVYFHYIVIEKVTDNYIIIFDPDKGKKKYNKEEFNDIWNNIIIELKPIRKLDKLEYKMSNLFIPIIKKNIWLYISIFIISFISILLTLINNYYFKYLIDSNKIIYIFILFTILLTTKELFDYIRNILIIKLEKNIDLYININTHNKLLTLPYYYFNSRSKGDIASKIYDLEYLKDLLIKVPIFFLVNIILMILSILIMINVSKTLFIVFLMPCILYFLVLVIFNNKNKNMIRDNQENHAYNNGILIENIDAINTIKNIDIIKMRNKKYEDSYKRYLFCLTKYKKTYNIESLLKNLFIYIGINLVLYYGIINVNNNNFKLSDLILFNSIMIYFIEPARSLYELNPVIKNGVNAFKRIIEIYLLKYKNKNTLNNKYDIKIKNLSFSYNNYDYVFQNINLNIKENEKIIVVGHSGCGKSTLFKLINKTYEIEEGKILIGDKDIKENNSNIIYVSQEETIFNDTLYNNLVLDKDVEIDDIHFVNKLTHLDKVIENKNIDLNYLIEESAINFSGGERQKIILTRVLLKKSNILILDEALNAIDENEEYQILKNILNKYNNKTIIYITHRNNCVNLFNREINFNKIKEGKWN